MLYRKTPFDPETVTSEAAADMWLYAVKAAQSAKREFCRAGNLIDARFWKDRALAVMLPFRYGISRRTHFEERSATYRVEKCEARFMQPACPEETCGTCELPVWQHIVGDWAKYCPVDGRPYWQLARAILSKDCTDPAVIREALAPIAVATRKSFIRPSTPGARGWTTLTGEKLP